MTLLAAAAIRPVFPPPEVMIETGVRIAVTLVVAFLVLRVLFLLVGRLERLLTRAGHGTPEAVQRSRTLGQISRNLCTVMVAASALIHILYLTGLDVRPLLAGAGILGVALGFGAQTLVRDVIAGVFILFENQYSVGDLIEVNGKPATVEAITVRVTTLRDFNGFIHYVPNGEMKIVTNRSRGWNRVAVDVAVASDQDVDRALEVCRRAVDSLNADSRWRDRLLDPVEVWGVESLSGVEVLIRIVVRARPGGDAPEATRELRRRVHRALSEAGIRSFHTQEAIPGAPPVGAAAAPR